MHLFMSPPLCQDPSVLKKLAEDPRFLRALEFIATAIEAVDVDALMGDWPDSVKPFLACA